MCSMVRSLTTLCSALACAVALQGARPAHAAPLFAIDPAMARTILFSADGGLPSVAGRCLDGDARTQIDCLLGARFVSDAKAARIARDLYATTGAVTGLLPSQDFDGAYRGNLHFVPHLPIKQDRQHLVWLAQALVDIDAFYSSLQTQAPLDYRWTDFDVRFFRSVKRKTPSAIAQGWRISYNVSGSLFTSAARVRETLVHEIFHLNDEGSDGRWSERALGPIYRRILVRCDVHDLACLAPFAPDSIVVRGKGGTYYAFMPDNGVTEYAADLAKRYFVEQRTVLQGGTVKLPFKCRTKENAEAWVLLAERFFGGVDRVPACPS